MEISDSKPVDSSQCVRVAVNIRPLITPEHLIGCTDCITVVHREPQVVIGSHTFTYDYVYGNTGSAPSTIYEDCVAPLIDALFNGYNATVLAYGQTGSGKTYTMGTNYNGDDINGGIIPKVMDNIYKRVEAMRNSVEFLIRVSFIEIFKEEVFDLLDSNVSVISKGEGALGKPFVPIRAPIQIRETINGGITLAGVTEPEVRTKEEMALYLSRGSLSRATGSTNMNSQSSRSHAIFTITMEQKKIVGGLSGVSHDDTNDDILCSKLHLVDLAGSERAKRTGADGMRLKEGIHINKGLLALGNVISALGDEKKRKEGGHVPYRDSKLTRLLQDSLGGNSKTVMIACVSPADTNVEETLNTLKYANRARNIQNKAIVNRDPTTTQIQRMKSQIEQLQSELLFYRGDIGGPYEELQILKHKVSLLEASNAKLKQEVLERQITCKHLSQRAIDAQVEKDKLIMKIEYFRNGNSWDEIDSTSEKDYDLVQSYVSKIQELEAELLHSKCTNGSTNRFHDCMDTDEDKEDCKNVLFPPRDDASDLEPKCRDFSYEIEDHEKELEHSSLQEKFDKELKELDKKLEMKEAEMKRVGGGDALVLKQHYEKKVQELEIEKRTLQREIEVLTCNLANTSSTSDDGAQKLKEEYLQKLNVLEAQVSELKKKQDAQSQLLRQKQKSDEAARKLQDEIQRIKSQKVQLQHKIKQESEQFRLWKASREKEVLQLKKEGRRNEYEMHKLLALNQRQKMVLQRKTEEAAQATKRLKDLLESRKASSRETSNFRNGNGSGLQALMQEIEHELEVTVHVHEVRSEYERQMEERGRMAKEAAMLKENNQSDSAQSMSPGARNSRVFALENMLATSSSTLVSMATQLSEAEECERLFSGRGRWNQVRSLVDAKNIMNFLFNLASSSRCLLTDKEVACREKESEIRELKQKLFNLNSSQRKLEMHNAELINQNLTLKNRIINNSMDPPKNRGFEYDSHKQEDMDTSESECSDIDDTTDDDWVDSAKHVLSKNNKDNGGRSDIDDTTDDDWVDSAKHVLRKNSKNNRGRSSMAPSLGGNPSPSPALDGCGEGISHPNGVTFSGLCCSCSKVSFCKTMKCKCRVNGGSCGSSCGCKLSRCTNRDGKNKQDVQSRMEVEENGNGFDIFETDRNQDLASHGAELLQGALTDKPVEARRKALSDIGNTQAKSNIPNPNHRKKWKKSTIQLVTDDSTPMQPNNNEAIQSQKPENNSTGEVNIPLKLPRAMRSPSSNGGGLLRERNVSQPDEQVGSKDGAAPVPPSPVRQKKKASDEKENFGI